MQIWTIIFILTMAVGYAAWRIYRVLQGKADPCQGCELKKNCRKFGQSKEKSYLCTR